MSKRWGGFLFTCILMAASLWVAGKDYPMLHFTKEDGLPGNTVYQIYRDSKGYLWFATDRGVARYNGIKFERFTTLDGLADNEVFSFLEDYEGRLWMASWNGKLCFYKDGIFHSETNTPFLKLPFSSPHIRLIILNKDSSLTFNYFDETLLLNVYKNTLTYLTLKEITDKHLARFIYKRKIAANKYEVICNNVSLIVDSTGTITEEIKKNGFDPIKCYPSQNNYYFIDTAFIYDEDKKIIRPLKKEMSEDYFINSFYFDGTNGFISTMAGLYINDTLQLLGKDHISTVTQDTKKNYWISTLNNGVFFLKKDFLNTKLIKDCYQGDVKYSYQDSNQIFFATSINNLYHLHNGVVHCLFDYQKFKKKIFKLPIEVGWAIHKKNNSYNFFAFYGREIININNIMDKFSEVRVNYNKFDGIGVKSILVTDSNIFVRTPQTIFRIDDCGKTTHSYINGLDRIFALVETKENNIYYSSISHVYKIQNEKSVIQSQFDRFSFYKFFVAGHYLLGLTFDYKIILFAGTDKEKVIDSITNQECIPHDIFILDTSHVIVSTNDLYRIITLLPPGNKPAYIISTTEDPFIPQDADAISSDGINCYFFKDHSILSVDLKSLTEKSEPPRLFYTLLKTRTKSYPIAGVVNLTYEESKDITISFSTLSFSGKEVFYQYQVSGDEGESWRALKGEEINLYNLGFGDYEIRIRAKTISSEYCGPIMFKLHIITPFWATWWFISLASLFSICIIYLIIRSVIASHIKKKEKENIAEVRLIRAEYQSLNALMNPHFIFNTLNNVQSLYDENDAASANEYLRIFADLIRDNMQNISKKLIPLQKEINLVGNYLQLEKMRFGKMMDYKINIDKGVDISDIFIPPLLIQPLVENSIKHGILPMESRIGLIEVNIYERNDILFIEVKDNGIGLSHSTGMKAGDHESMGIENIKKRIRQLSIIQDKEITFNITEQRNERGEQEWTIATISIPV